MPLTEIGPQWDRRWMVVDQHNRFITQREISLMCLIQANFFHEELTLSAVGMESFTLSINASRNQLSVTVWEDEVVAEDCGNCVAQWLSDFLKIDCRLVYIPDTSQRLVDKKYASRNETVSFADGFPLLLISDASLADFNQHLSAPVNMDRFRPNIVVTGCEPYAEDHWQRLKIGLIEFSVVKPCSRCIIPSINPNTGDKLPDVASALASHRRRDGAVYFGQNLLHRGTGSIAVGDEVELIT
jgi:uncharacterized protein YcbX